MQKMKKKSEWKKVGGCFVAINAITSTQEAESKHKNF